MTTQSRTQMLVLTGLSIALIATGAFITVPLGPVPFTLQTLMVGIVLCLLPPKYAACAVGGYLLLGSLGLPVFSGFRGGIGVLAGPTGGFLIGFFVATLIIAFLRSRVLAIKAEGKRFAAFRSNTSTRKNSLESKASASKSSLEGKTTTTANELVQAASRPAWMAPALDIVSIVLLSIIYYIFGCAWFMVSTGASIEATLAACFIPFVIPDIIKGIAAFFCSQAVRSALGMRQLARHN